jgi:hypothetical protein
VPETRSGSHDKVIQFWYPIRVFLEEEANNFRTLGVCFEAFSLEKNVVLASVLNGENY